MSTAILTKLGFSVPRLGYTTRTALAACLALLVAWLLGLEHPQWSAMTVWASSQPMRGQLIERSFFRMAGTVVGTVAGVLLVLAAGDQLPSLVIGLATWIGLCAGIGNLQRSHLSYGTMLAGYSAAMVALLDTTHPDRVLHLGGDRLLTVLVGVLTALVVGLIFTPRQSPEDLNGRIRALSARVLRDMALRLRGQGGDASKELSAILSDMASIEEALDPHAAGSLRSRRAARAIRALLAAQAAALIWLRGSDAALPIPSVSSTLERTAEALEGATDGDELIRLMAAAVESAREHPPLRRVLMRMEGALRDHLGAPAREGRPAFNHPVILHRDRVGARQAAIRAGATLLLLGVIWIVTGWTMAPFMMLGASIMLLVFSTFDSPARSLWFVFLGQLGGVIAALLCRWLVWPFGDSEFALVLMAMPFVLSGALPMAHARTAPGALDYNMAMLLMLQPAYPLTLAFWPSVAMSVAVVAGPLSGLAAYKVLFPVDARRRMLMLAAMMVREIEAMAASRDAIGHRRVWRARLFHRMLRLIRWKEKVGERELAAVDGSLAVLALGEAVLRLQSLLNEPGAPLGATRSAKAALGRLARVGRDPVRAWRVLERTARRLRTMGRPEADAVRDGAQALALNLTFFQCGAGGAGRRSEPH